jgi:PST family polysaccharide transporter
MTDVTPSPDGEATVDEGRRKRKNKKGDKKTYGKTAKLGALWSLMRQGGNELIGVPVSFILARLLTPYDFGVCAASTLFIQLAGRLMQFGFGAALIRIKELRPEHVSTVYVTNHALGLLTFGVLYATAPMMGAFFRSAEAGELMKLAALTFAIAPLGMIPAALMQRRMQFKYTVLCDWMDTVIGAIVSVVLAFKGFAYWSPVFGHLSALVIRVMVQMYLAAWLPSFRWSRTALREVLSFGLGIQSKRLLDYAASHLDNAVVGRMLGMSALGIYTKAFNTMNKMVIRMTLGHAPFRIFSIIHEDRERFARAYSRLILSITLLAYPVLAACMAAAEPLFYVLYGPNWLPAVLPFQLLCLGGMLKLLNAYSSQANEAVGNIWRQVRRQVLGAALVLAGALVGAFAGGLPGVAVGVLVAWTVLTIMLLELVREATGLTWRAMLTPLVPAVTCAAAMGVLLTATAAAVRAAGLALPPWQLLLLQTLVGTLFYLTFVVAGPFDQVREIVGESVDDLLPAGPARVVQRFLRPMARA